MKEENNNWQQRNTKDFNKILWKIICHQTGQPGQNIKFLETYNIPKIYHEETENLNRQIIPSEIEAVIKNKQTKKLPTNKRTGPDGFTGESY